MRMGMGVLAMGFLAWAAGAARAENVLSTSPDAPAISLVTKQSNVMPGGQVAVEVFVSSVQDLAAYEIRLNVMGGESGTLTLKKITVDQQRADYVFKNAGVQILDAVDMTQQRVGMVRFGGGSTVPAGQQAYLATFVFEVSPDATGKFAIMAANPEATFLNNSVAEQIPHRLAGALEVAVQQPTPVRMETRKKG